MPFFFVPLPPTCRRLGAFCQPLWLDFRRRPLPADVYKGAALFVLYTLALIAWFTTFQVLKDGVLSGLSVLDDNKANSVLATLAN